MTKIIRNLSISLFIATLAISIWVSLCFTTPAINEYHLSAEQNKQVQNEMRINAKKIQNILFEASVAATAIYLANENVIRSSDSEKLIKESVDTLSTHSERLGKLAKYISDYQLKQKRKDALIRKHTH